MGASRFDKPQAANFMNTYIPLPFKEMVSVAAPYQQKHDIRSATAAKAKGMYRNINYNKNNESAVEAHNFINAKAAGLVDDLMAKYGSDLNTAEAQMAYNDALTEITTDPVAKQLQKDYATKTAADAAYSEAVQKNLVKNYTTTGQQYSTWQKDAEGNMIQSTPYRGTSFYEYQDDNDSANKLVDKAKADEWAVNELASGKWDGFKHKVTRKELSTLKLLRMQGINASIDEKTGKITYGLEDINIPTDMVNVYGKQYYDQAKGQLGADATQEEISNTMKLIWKGRAQRRAVEGAYKEIDSAYTGIGSNGGRGTTDKVENMLVVGGVALPSGTTVGELHSNTVQISKDMVQTKQDIDLAKQELADPNLSEADKKAKQDLILQAEVHLAAQAKEYESSKALETSLEVSAGYTEENFWKPTLEKMRLAIISDLKPQIQTWENAKRLLDDENAVLMTDKEAQSEAVRIAANFSADDHKRLVKQKIMPDFMRNIAGGAGGMGNVKLKTVDSLLENSTEYAKYKEDMDKTLVTGEQVQVITEDTVEDVKTYNDAQESSIIDGSMVFTMLDGTAVSFNNAEELAKVFDFTTTGKTKYSFNTTTNYGRGKGIDSGLPITTISATDEQGNIHTIYGQPLNQHKSINSLATRIAINNIQKGDPVTQAEGYKALGYQQVPELFYSNFDTVPPGGDLKMKGGFTLHRTDAAGYKVYTVLDKKGNKIENIFATNPAHKYYFTSEEDVRKTYGKVIYKNMYPTK